jgi:hypothetical protein
VPVEGVASNRRDPKDQRDALALAALCGRRVERLPVDCIETAVPLDVNYRCPRCAVNVRADFPLASNQQVIAILGYL